MLLPTLEKPLESGNMMAGTILLWRKEFSTEVGELGGNCCLVAKLCLTFLTPWTVACQALLSMEFSRQV